MINPFVLAITVLVAMASFFVAYGWLRPLSHAAGRSAFSAKTQKRFLRLARPLLRLIPASYQRRVEKRIGMAGGLGGLTPERFMINAILIGILGLVLGVLLLASGRFFLGCFFLGLGLVLPEAWLRDRVQRRHQAILRQLPYHLDLLTLGVEAGLDFSAAMAKMVEKAKAGPLREEFTFMLSQIRMGTSRAEAMKAMSTRLELPAMSAFLSALLQADKLGMSIGKVLRIQSETVRTERSQRAEKRANEAPVKILIPLVIFIFPTIWIILAGPLFFSWMF